MKCDELTPIELECNMGKDINGVVNREPWKAYDIDEVDEAISELKSENKMLKEHIANGDVSRITWIDEATELKAENEQLKAKLESVQASAYADSVDAWMRERRLRRALWFARAELCRRLDVDRYLRKHRNSRYNEEYLTWNEACVAMEVKMCKAESKCLAKAEEYK